MPTPAILSLLLASHAEGAEVVGTTAYTHPTLQLTAVSGAILLPTGRWEAVAPAGVYLVAPEGDAGVRSREAVRERESAQGAHPLHFLFHACRVYAQKNQGRAPRSLDELEKDPNFLARSPYPSAAGAKGPFVFLIPDVPVRVDRRPGPDARPLAFELQPLFADGRHFVLLNDGRVERRPIDPALLKAHGAVVKPFLAGPAAEPAAPGAHRIYALRRGEDVLTVRLVERASGEERTARWDLRGAISGSPEVLAAWAEARAEGWPHGESPILKTWGELLKSLYGARTASEPPRNPGRATDIFSLLGGRAALQETLQLQLLNPGKAGGADVPLKDLKGVAVKSHPFEEMLKGAPGERLALADVVLPERLFVYFAKPAALFPFLDDGAGFLARAGSLFTKTDVDDDLKGRALRRLGLEEGFGRKFLASGEVTEVALVTPDLFFIDGTDLTLLMRLAHPDKAASMMKGLGIVDAPEGVVVAKKKAYWLRLGDLLFVSTRKEELEGALALSRADGARSLGQSAEFRYMLAQLPIKKETRALVYLSDPFIRLMTGPEIKIGQFRRMQAKAEMERIVAGALLYQMDRGGKPALKTLGELGYVPQEVAGRYTLHDDLTVTSPVWGTTPELKTLPTVPFDTVTAGEAAAYRAYVEEYSRYWRQYFDPVALRLDDAPGGALDLQVFILPLADSQVYGRLRELLAVGDAPLRIPHVTPEPALLLSMNLAEKAWVDVAGHWREVVARAVGVSPKLFDLLGPGFHLAVQDGDPIVVLGNADILGGFGGNAMAGGLMRTGIPLLLSVLTRPCKVLIELQDEKAALALLRQAAVGSRPGGRPWEMQAQFRQVGERDAWILSLGAAGVVRVRFGLEVKDGFLVVSNIPWSQPVALAKPSDARLNGAKLTLSNRALRIGLPGLHATQQEQNQAAALAGLGYLYPLLATGSATPEEAARRHAALFGFTPLHHGPGRWVWKDGRLESSAYGDARRWKSPEYRAEDGDFGIMKDIDEASVEMRFEDDGLLASCRWIPKGG